MKEVYLAGQIDVLIDAFYDLKGVEQLTPGIGTSREGDELHGINLGYNPKKIDLTTIFNRYFETVNPYIQAENAQEQSGIFYTSAEDLPQLEYYIRFLANRGAEPIASLGSLIVNDSMLEGKEMRPLLTRLARAKDFTAD